MPSAGERRISGMSSAAKHHHRFPLWKRAALHSLKVLVRRHPGAVLSAAGAGVAYAGREAVQEGTVLVREKVATVVEALAPDDLSTDKAGAPSSSSRADGVSAEESRALARSLTPEQRAALAALAPGK